MRRQLQAGRPLVARVTRGGPGRTLIGLVAVVALAGAFAAGRATGTRSAPPESQYLLALQGLRQVEREKVKSVPEVRADDLPRLADALAQVNALRERTLTEGESLQGPSGARKRMRVGYFQPQRELLSGAKQLVDYMRQPKADNREVQSRTSNLVKREEQVDLFMTQQNVSACRSGPPQ